MSEKKQNQSRQGLLTGLLVLLVVIVAFQAWYLIGMKQQVDSIHAQQATVQSMLMSAESTTPAAETNSTPVTDPVNAQVNVQAVTSSQAGSSASGAPGATSSGTGAGAGSAAAPDSSPLNDLLARNFYTDPANDPQRWNPYAEIQRMQRDMDRIFNQAFSRFNDSPDFQHLFQQTVTTPEMDVQEDENQYTVIVNLPGASEDNISVNLDGQVLSVKGEQRFEKQDRDHFGNIIFQERRSGSFQRSITLPEPVKQSGMKTHVDNGVLTIIVPKA